MGKGFKMSVRVTYEHELGLLNQDLMEMAHMVERAIEQTFTAFEDQDFQMAEDIIKGDRTVNDMERAIEAPAGDDYKTGVDMVLRQFRELLMGMGLEEIEAENAPFNPEVHNAVMREDADGIEPETVTAVFQKGYKYGDRVLRPAMVKVAN